MRVSRAVLIGLVLTSLSVDGAGATGGKSVALVLDASGSMNARLPEGRTRIDAAKAAIEQIVTKLAPDIRLSLRVYGHQSPTREKNCRDTELMVGFDAVGRNRDAVLAKVRGIRAQGYTPITHVLQLAAQDLGREDAKARVVILVSDGKETCEGDPCAAAKALADADASLVVHTIGFAVDTAARYQLQCVARVGRGQYSDAESATSLASAVGEAVEAEAKPATRITIQVPRQGKLQVKNVDLFGHDVTDAATGNKVAQVTTVRTTVELPAGLYNVTFGPTVWKSVEVKGGETTVLEPGVVEVRNASIFGHNVLDWETGNKLGEVSNTKRRLTVIPSTFTVTFGGVRWENVEVKSGEVKVLNPGVIRVKGADMRGHAVHAEDGTLVATLSPISSQTPVPPGKYTVEAGGQKMALDVAEGQVIEIDRK